MYYTENYKTMNYYKKNYGTIVNYIAIPKSMEL